MAEERSWSRRPSRANAAAQIAAQLTKPPQKSYILRVSTQTHTGMKIEAAKRGVSMKRLILEGLRALGTDVDPADLADEGEA